MAGCCTCFSLDVSSRSVSLGVVVGGGRVSETQLGLECMYFLDLYTQSTTDPHCWVSLCDPRIFGNAHDYVPVVSANRRRAERLLGVLNLSSSSRGARGCRQAPVVGVLPTWFQNTHTRCRLEVRERERFFRPSSRSQHSLLGVRGRRTGPHWFRPFRVPACRFQAFSRCCCANTLPFAAATGTDSVWHLKHSAS
jgi:hypothetical protein